MHTPNKRLFEISIKLMIKESIQHTIKLIEGIQKVDPKAYKDEKVYLESLVQHMKIVIVKLEIKRTSQQNL